MQQRTITDECESVRHCKQCKDETSESIACHFKIDSKIYKQWGSRNKVQWRDRYCLNNFCTIAVSATIRRKSSWIAWIAARLGSSLVNVQRVPITRGKSCRLPYSTMCPTGTGENSVKCSVLTLHYIHTTLNFKVTFQCDPITGITGIP